VDALRTATTALVNGASSLRGAPRTATKVIVVSGEGLSKDTVNLRQRSV
jgi:hypothetical protein